MKFIVRFFQLLPATTIGLVGYKAIKAGVYREAIEAQSAGPDDVWLGVGLIAMVLASLVATVVIEALDLD